MGKPSSTRLSQDSEQPTVSNSLYKMNNSIRKKKLGVKKRKSNKKTLNNVFKVFQQLKADNSSVNSSYSSVSSINNTIIDLDTIKTPVKSKDTRNSLIVICDDDDTNPTANITNMSPPIHSSTPNSKVKLKKSNSCNKTQNTDVNLTKDINQNSFLTIDLTGESTQQNTNTVIDLVNSSDKLNFTSISDVSLSMSDDSEVTVLNMQKNTQSKQMQKYVKGISKMNCQERGKLLEMIMQTVFNGCDVQQSQKNLNIQAQSTRATETVEDAYIKEVILGQSKSRNSIGSNIYNPEKDLKNRKGLRRIIIDGSNVAMQHTMGRKFSVKGLQICIEYFTKRGHDVTAFVPRFRCKFGKSTEPRLLDSLERSGLVVYTPSREIQGKMITSYDDRYIVQCAAAFDGVIVSCDNYRDLLSENPRWRFVIENRLLPFTWVGDMIMFPKDPLGRNGPTLEQFLKH
ncbi:PREDICTED: NEDD4-binding protein 1-like isoform X1 [Papilio xuthus]|uniref:NEDD4-binding protein 1-like isoform X1 n=2 Tax=Papilio xuthus TaxID=66420 RepID=A0AAJ7E5S8_PAPXU|nr:PREDICTED: NEDD4-binding protein 1-like isoform X1 [Papilio xuthus]